MRTMNLKAQDIPELDEEHIWFPIIQCFFLSGKNWHPVFPWQPKTKDSGDLFRSAWHNDLWWHEGEPPASSMIGWGVIEKSPIFWTWNPHIAKSKKHSHIFKNPLNSRSMLCVCKPFLHRASYEYTTGLFTLQALQMWQPNEEASALVVICTDTNEAAHWRSCTWINWFQVLWTLLLPTSVTNRFPPQHHAILRLQGNHSPFRIQP